jgi:hypothetical protein
MIHNNSKQLRNVFLIAIVPPRFIGLALMRQHMSKQFSFPLLLPFAARKATWIIARTQINISPRACQSIYFTTS